MFRFLSSNRPNRTLAEILSLAAVGSASALVVSSCDDDRPLRFRFPIPTISVSTPLRQFISQQWNPAAIGLSPQNFSMPSPISSDHLKKEASGEKGDDSECGRGCLGRNAIANAAAAAGPAVVNISVTRGEEKIDLFEVFNFIVVVVVVVVLRSLDGVDLFGVLSILAGFEGLMLGKSMGSGTIIDPNGTILTCAHVVVDFEGSRTVTKGKVDVTLQDGREYVGTVVNADLHSDIAIVKIKSKTPLPAVKLGLSSKLRPGDWVVAVGCPLSLQNTVTAGIVSCVDRKSSDLGLGGIRREYLQTDCAINEGNSGGPLVNLDGEVVGINMLKVVNADGLSFAVPIDSAVKIIEHFKKNGRVVPPWLGLKMLDLNDMIIAQLKEKDASFPDVSKGVLVPMVTPGSPADRAGFRPGDVVIEFDGKPIGGVKEIINIMGDKIGVPLKVLVKRANNKLITLTVVPEEANPDR